MIQRLSMTLWLILSLLAIPSHGQQPESTDASATSAARQVHRYRLAPNTPDATEWVEIDSGQPGPTVWIIGGVHGDEPAGYRAARQITGWTPTRGRLLILPRANDRALKAGKRRTPELAKERSDLNRQFPMAVDKPPQTVLARAIWKRIEDSQPDLLLDLHEGYDFTQINPDSVGSSIIADARPETLAQAQRMLDALNGTIKTEKKKFVLKRVPIAGSLARAAAERLSIPSMILETTRKDQCLAYRARQHRIMVHRALFDLGMIRHGPDRRIGHRADEDDLCVGLYHSTGVGGNGPSSLERLLVKEHDFIVCPLSIADVRAGQLDEFDVLIFPGGSASSQAKAIGEDGRAIVRDFVRDGGGYLGICAGAYLAANNYDWSLKILDLDVIDRAHWARGRGPVPLEFTRFGRDGLTRPRTSVPVLYANGPIYAPSKDPDIPDARVLARFDGEVIKKDVPRGVMPGTPALVCGEYGEGVVVCSSPHPEQTEGFEELVRDLVRMSAGR